MNPDGERFRTSKVSLGQVHTRALTSKKAVLYWDYNGNGQLGDGTHTDSAKPVLVSGF